ncbi:MAG: preprotein translocase subunit YajC [Oscillospiraceae bacterium]|jgi:preprotein translocase subunit YajC|nr:preprotein translocase subunit YajC [Oscillospiraceae bacterium]
MLQEYLLTAQPQQGSMMSSILMMAAIFGVLYFIMIRPQKKKDKEAQAMRNALEVGDEIMTAGGILGRVVAVKEDADSILIETGSANTKIRVSKTAVHTNITAGERVRERQQELAKQRELEKEAKKNKKALKDKEE